MNNNIQYEQINDKRPLHSSAKAAGFIIAAGGIGALSALPIMSVVFTVASAALFAYMFFSLRHPSLSFISPVLSAALIFLVTKNFFPSLLCAAEYTAAGFVISLCIRKKASVYTAVAAGAAAFIIMIALNFEYSVYINYGSFIAGTKTFFSEIYSAVFENVKNVYSLAKVDIIPTDDQIKTLLTSAAVIIPGIFTAAAEIFAAAVYFSAALISHITKTFKYCFPRGFKAKIPVASAVFFLLSGNLILIFSLWESAEIFCYTAINMYIILFLPMTVEGVVRVLNRFRRSKTPASDENRAPIAPRFMIIGTAIMLLLINPVFPFLFVACFGAIDVVREAVSASVKNRVDKNT